MYIRKSMRTKLVILAIIVLGFLYWRGMKATLASRGIKCNYGIGYALCDAKGKSLTMPGILEVLKAGAKF